MKIAIVHHQIKLKGGMETYLFDLIREFSRQGDIVTTFVYKKNFSGSLAASINYTNLFYLPRSLKKFWFGSRIYKKQKEQNFDFRLTLMRAINQDVLVCGGTHLGYLKSCQKKSRILDRVEIKLEKKCYQSASIIIAHSEAVKDELMFFYNVPEEKIVKILPPADGRRFHQNFRDKKAIFRRKFNLHPDKITVLFPSTGHKRKGFSILVDAIKQLPENDFQLVVAGDAPLSKLPNCVHVGFVQNMIELYTASDVTVLPSLYEPFGLVVLESVLCGVPVILSPHVGAKELISENEGIVLSELTAEAISAALLRIQNRTFKISPHFAEEKKLTISEHIHKIKTLWPG